MPTTTSLLPSSVGQHGMTATTARCASSVDVQHCRAAPGATRSVFGDRSSVDFDLQWRLARAGRRRRSAVPRPSPEREGCGMALATDRRTNGKKNAW